MSLLRVVLARLRGLFRRNVVADEIRDELQFHLRERTEQYERDGLTPDDAARKARRRLGSLSLYQDQGYDLRGGGMMELFLQDLRHAWRRLRRAPTFTVPAILTLAVAVGANSAILSIADGVLFRPLPYEDPDRVFLIQRVNRTTGDRVALLNQADIETIRAHRGLSEIGQYLRGPTVLADTLDGVEQLRTLTINPAYLRVLGVRPEVGRIFADEDVARADRVAMLSYAAWRRRFNEDPAIVGATISFRNASFEIVGVLRASFYFPSYADQTSPEIVTVMATPPPDARGGMVHPIVRLLPGVSREQAQAELDSLFPPKAPYAAARGSFVPYLDDIRSNMNLAGGPIARFLVAAAALVMLLGCANLAGMLLVRSRREERETAIRTALGASRLRVIRPVVLEGVFIGVAGSALAVVVTAFTSDALIAQVPSAAYGNIPVGVDHRVIFISLGLGVVGGLIFAGVPAWRRATADVLTVVQGRHHRSSATGRRAGWPLVMTQIALAIVLVCGAVMATKALIAVLRVPLGFNPDDVVTLSVAGAPEGVDVTSFYRTVLEEIASRGDVVAAGAVATLPVTSSPFVGEVQLGSSDYPVGVYLIWPGYFEAAGIVPIRGRTLDWSDATSGAMAVFSESAARTIFGDRDPIGHMYGNGRGDQWQVVGVVPDVRHDLAREGRPAIYQVPDPDSRSARFPMTIVVRTRMRTGAIVGDLKKQLYAMAPGSAIRAAWWSDTIADVTAIRNPRFQTLVLSSFAGIALGLTALGVFGVVAFLVVSRSKEVALRMAIGAEPGALVLLMIRQALLPVVAGLALGLLAMQLLSGLAEAQLYDVNTNDPLTLIGAAATVVLVAIVAAWIPARRAAKIDPLVTLRAE